MNRIQRALVALVATSAVACGESTPTPQPPITVGGGDFVVDIAGDARTITLRRRDTALLTFPADAFQLGTVPQLSQSLAYDPFIYETDDMMARREWPDGFAWRQLTSMK